jgi:phage shock protein PspC (stress-responsive transcriptional regulator)
MVPDVQMADPDGMDEQTVTIDAPPFPPPAPPTGPKPRWFQLPVSRDPSDDQVGGVISGLSRTYGFDVRTSRIAVAISTLVLPIIAIFYVAAWVLLPKRPDEAMSFEQIIRDRRRVPLYIAIALVIVAGGVGSFGSWFFLGGASWGVGLIAIGVLLWVAPGLMRGDGDSDRPSDATTPPPSPATTVFPAGSPATGTSATGTSATGTVDTGTVADRPWTTARPLQIDDIRPRRRRRPVGPIVALVVLAFIGIASAGDALDWWDIPVLTTLVVSVISIAVGAIVSAIVNRSWVSLPLAAMLAPIAVGLLITQPDLDGGIGERVVAADTIAAAERNQQLGMGELRLDLTNVPMDQLAEALDVQAEVGIGHLVVIVPDDATLVINAEIGAGDVMLDGINVGDGMRHEYTRTVTPDGVSVGTIDLDLRVGMGRIDVETEFA